jgi:2-keto-4-pentenoate hydratase/2-oxohepta-3-ene-1,7-dioic acid hydratase in catechol pathway
MRWIRNEGQRQVVEADDAKALAHNLNLDPPVEHLRMVWAIGLNYRDHAAESGFTAPEQPAVFTKFPSCITGPYGEIALPAGGHTDWEVELVVIMGRRAENVRETDAWRHVAGLAVGQDLSERITQLAGPAPQFSLGKSFPGFGPIGPWLVTADELDDPATSSSAARSTASRCRKDAPATSSSRSRSSSPGSRRSCRCSPATSSSPAPRPGSASATTRSAGSPPPTN